MVRDYLNLIRKLSLSKIALLQASGLFLYCGLVAIIFWKGNDVFGKMNSYIGPVAFLLIFVVSALVCALIGLAYPFLVFWENKKPKEALKIVIFTTFWLMLFVLFLLTLLAVF